MFTIDAHLDLAMNAMEWNRDLRLPVSEINERENGLTDKPDRAKAVVSLAALREGQVGLVVATQIARYVAPDNPLPGWHSPEQAWAQTQGQLAWYKAMEASGEMVQINTVESLDKQVAFWLENSSDQKPVGYILSLEGADSIINLDYLHLAHEQGLRALGPAHYGPGRYANGTDASGKMGLEGLALLKEMEKLGIILDATHLCDDAFWQAMDHFNGPIWASHNNSRALVNHNRQYSDEQIRTLVERKAVIGAAMDAWMLVPDWKRGTSDPKSMDCGLDKVVDHIDHICQVAGNAKHVGIGSDLDGAFGREQCPYDLHTIADLKKLPERLAERAYTQENIEDIMHGNWLRFIREAWS